MSWLDEFSELKRRAQERLRELEPLVAEYQEVRQLVDRLDDEREAESSTPTPAAAPAASPAKPAAPASRPARTRAAAKRTPAVKPQAAKTAPASTRRRAAAKPATASDRRPGRGRTAAKPGERERQLLELVGARPGIKVSEIAPELGVDATGLYAIVRRLHQRGRLSKDGQQLRLAGESAATSQPSAV
jgi:hypothetical protein